MKNIKIVSLTRYVICLFALILFNSCSNDDKSDASSSTPVITSVVQSGYDDNDKLIELTPVTQGYPKNYYIIRGSGLSSVKKIYFNDYDTYFGPAFVTDTEIFVLLDEKTPYANGSNKLKLETSNGTVLYDFVVMPPTPTFGSFNPINAADGEEVTIYGKYFLNPIVTLAATATKPAINVPVISSTLEKIVIKLPADSQHRKISVTNISGTSTSLEAIGTALYDDELHGKEWGGPWGGSLVFDHTKDSFQGQKSMEWVMDAWTGGNWGFNYDMTPYKAFRIAVKGKKNGKFNLMLNDGGNYEVKVTTSWVYMEIPLSTWGNPSSVTKLTFQESNNDSKDPGNTILFDDLGFVLK